MTDAIWRVELVVMPKDGVNDPQGEAVRAGLRSLGHDVVNRVRVGRHLHIDVCGASEAAVRAQVERMADQLLANPVIEQYSITGAVRVMSTGVA